MTRDTSCESMMRNKGKHQKGVKNLFKDNNFRDWFHKGMKQNRFRSQKQETETETKQHTKRLMSETETATQNGISNSLKEIYQFWLKLEFQYHFNLVDIVEKNINITILEDFDVNDFFFKLQRLLLDHNGHPSPYSLSFFLSLSYH